MSDSPVDSDETRRLLEQAQAGNGDALELLLERHRPYLMRLVESRLHGRLRRRVGPSDVVQEAQLEVVRRMGEYLANPTMPFRLWIRRLACDRLLMAQRRHIGADKRAVQREVPLPDRSSLVLARRLMDPGATPSEALTSRETARRVRMAMASLPEIDREVLTMRTFEGLTFGEIAYVLAIEPAAARKRHGRALMRLHRLLSGDRPESGP